MREIGHFIGGKQVKGTGRTADVFNPDTGEVRAKVALASKGEVEQAIANAQALSRNGPRPTRSAAPASCSSSWS